MRANELVRLSQGFSDIVNRLDSLKNQPICPFQTWPKIYEWRSAALALFHKSIDLLKQQCISFRDNLHNDSRDFEQWTYNLDYLWYLLDRLRIFYNRMFNHDYLSLIYHHIFVGEMLECLPIRLEGARSKFILAPTGTLRMLHINRMLSSIAPEWFDDEYQIEFNHLRNEEPIICFDCHPEKNYERQAILGHEIFHIIVHHNRQLRTIFTDLLSVQQLQVLLETSDEENFISKVEELFCDYAAGWYYGPIYLQAFADEITYYPQQPSYTQYSHPSNTVRSKQLLYANSTVKDHKGYSSVKNYLHLHGGTAISSEDKILFRKLIIEFDQGLASLGLKKYKYKNNINYVKKSFDENIPFVVADIRDLINNLPSPDEIEKPQNHPDLISESLRKTNILREIKEHIREPDTLFAIPPAISS